MNLTRREFVKESLVTLGFLALPGGLWAAPAGWKPKGRKPNLVFGVLADTHLMVNRRNGKTLYPTMRLDYIRNAFKYFRTKNIDAFVHLGDASHRGDIREWEFHKEVYEEVFGKSGPPRIVVVGNHELFECDKEWFPNDWRSRMIGADLARHYERIWGMPYAETLHREINGYHFFGTHWGVDGPSAQQHGVKMANYINAHAEEFALKGEKPFFILSHKMTYFACNSKLREFPNAIGFCGHWHTSLANWQSIYYERNYKLFPYINCGACRYDGENGLRQDGLKERPNDLRDPGDHHFEFPSRQGLVVSVYDDMVVMERREFGEGGSLGPEWVFPVGKFDTKPYSKDTLAAKIGSPEFSAKAKLDVAKAVVSVYERKQAKGEKPRKEPGIRIGIPEASGNPASRAFAYDVVVQGDDPKARYFKSVYFSGVNAGIGHEPNKGLTRVDIPASELPAGKKLTIAVRPVSSLGTKGKTIGTTFKV